jgi:exodeoxyribonuclease VII large subunit
VVAALRRCNREGRAEVAVIARGGGSFEELYAFNTEPVARAILASRVPVVTALGHTSDRTVADMVADAECRTPTEAATRIVPSKADLSAQLAERARRLDREAARRLAVELERLQQRRIRLGQALPALLRVRRERLERCRAELARLNPARQVVLRHDHLVHLGQRLDAAAQRAIRARASQLEARRVRERLDRAMSERLRAAQTGLAHRGGRLQALSPQRVLSRGYSITTDEHGRVLRSGADAEVGRPVDVRMAVGSLRARVEEVRE